MMGQTSGNCQTSTGQPPHVLALVKNYEHSLEMIRFWQQLAREQQTELLSVPGLCECGHPGRIRADCPQHGRAV